jgi:hypothetical protein
MRCWWFIAVMGCGRVGFDPTETNGDGGGGGDAGGDAATVSCVTSHPTALFCDGFEQMESWDYTVIDFGRADIATTRAYHGARALEIETFAIADYKAARWGKNFLFASLATGDVYVRAYYWMSSTTVITDQASIMVIGNFAPPYPSAHAVLVPDELFLNVSGISSGAPFEFPRDRWVCFQLHVFIDGTAGFGEAFVDGVQIMRTPAGDSTVMGGYTNMDIGVHYATPAQQGVTMWIDEVVADTSPIGCD